MDLLLRHLGSTEMASRSFIKELKKLPGYTSTPVCVLTTESEQGKLEVDMSTLKDAWITKPVQPAHVLNVVGELLSD